MSGPGRVRRRLRAAARTDQGWASVLGLVFGFMFLGLVAVVVEEANAMIAAGHATDVAQQAARAGAEQLDPAALRTAGQVRIDPAAARAAARAYLDQVGEGGDATATPTEVTVTVTVTEHLVLAPAISFTVSATATAAPITE